MVLACDKERRDSSEATYLEEKNQRGSLLHIALGQSFVVLKCLARMDDFRGLQGRLM